MDDHISEAVGRPDLIRLDDSLTCLRFETMKAVSALAAVRHLLETGAVRPGDTLIDSSSGIYAYALALACHRYELRCHIIGSAAVDRTLRTQLEVLGVRLELMRGGNDLKLDQNRRVARIREILAEHPEYHWMRQYHDDIHDLGYAEVADRIASEAGAGPLTLVGGVGTGVSTGALAQQLRRRAVDVRLVGVQPFGSVTFGCEHVADPEIIIAGIGSSIPFGNVRHDRYDTVHWTAFDAALSGSIDLLRRHAVFAGLSAGAAYLAARWECRAETDRTVMFVAADTGHRYVDTVFDRHREAIPLEDLAPRQVRSSAEVDLPWSRMDWNGSSAPAAAVPG